VHIEQLDLNLLVVFHAVHAEGGVTRAAQKLHLTQPAISHALGRLRDLLGDPLFVRKGRRLVATPRARDMIAPVRRALRGLELALDQAERFDARTSERAFTIGLRATTETILLPRLTLRLAKAAPRAKLATVSFRRHALETELASGSLDLVLDVRLPHGETIRHQRTTLDRLVVLVRRTHPAARKRRLDLATYLAAEHVLVSSRRTGPGLEDTALAGRGLQRVIRMRCQDYFAACRVIAGTDLLLTMPEHYAAIANESFGNRILRLPFEAPSLDLYTYWHRDVEQDPASRWLRRQVKGAFSTRLGPP
jgi:DNA-binding transcriptional LysR family regulator